MYRPRQRALGRAVALKVFLPRGPTRKEDVRRFLREAKTMARLPHPNIATILDVITRGRMRVVVMEYLPGGTLGDRQQHQGTRLFRRVPRLDLGDGRLIADEDCVDVIAQQLFGEFGLISIARDEVGERTEHGITEALPLGEQRSCCWSEPDAIALERLQGGTPRRDPGDILFNRTTLCALTCFAIPRLPEEEARLRLDESSE